MAGSALTADSSLSCPHGGEVQITSTNSRVQAEGSYLATATDTFVVSGCPFQIPATPPIPSPCTMVVWVLPDMRVRVDGMPSLSQGSVGICLAATGIPQGPVVVSDTQSSVDSQ